MGVMCERVRKDEKNKDVARKLFAIADALSKYALPSPEPNRVVVLEWLRCMERLCKFGVVKKGRHVENDERYSSRRCGRARISSFL